MTTSALPDLGTVYAVLLNHRAARDALGEAAHAKPYDRPPDAPVLYLRPANTWTAHGGAVTLPDDCDEVLLEPTFGIVFDRATSRVGREQALDHVAGYVVVADLTVRHDSFYRPAIRDRNRDGFCVFAPSLAEAPVDVDASEVRILLGDDTVASSPVAGLVRDVPALIADTSEFMRFEAGDVLLVGAIGLPVAVRRGDRVRVEIDGLGAVSVALATTPAIGNLPAGPIAPATATTRIGRSARRARPRTGRIAWQGAIHDVVEADGRVRLADGRLLDEDQPVWLPPLAPTPRPRAVYALGLNYADHAKELAFKAPDEPLLFMKGASSFVGHRGVTPRPADATYMHYECELAVVIGRTARGVRREDAYDFVDGYTVANDYAIRDYLENWYRPNLRVKNREASTPIGPWLVDATLVPDPMNVALRTTVDGRITQRGSTRDMIFDVPFLIEYLSSFLTLSPGDVILTGTPEGLVDVPVGSVVVTEVEGVGRLVNNVVAA